MGLVDVLPYSIMTKKQKIAYYVLLILISLNFIAAAIPKLTNNDQAVQGFISAGLPLWFMYTIGVGELLGVIGLWTKKFFRYAYEGLFLVLLGAIGTTFAFVSHVEALFPLITAILLGLLVWLHNKKGTPVQG